MKERLRAEIEKYEKAIGKCKAEADAYRSVIHTLTQLAGGSNDRPTEPQPEIDYYEYYEEPTYCDNVSCTFYGLSSQCKCLLLQLAGVQRCHQRITAAAQKAKR
jgi:hypothetical protein